jgi:site-specific recombinase XerD
MTATLTLEQALSIIAEPLKDKRYRATRLGGAVADYLAWKENEDGAAPSTLDEYERVLARMCVRLAATSILEVTTEDLRQVRDTFPALSRHKTTAALRDFWRWLYQEARIDADPSARMRYPKRTSEIRIETFSDAEWEALVSQPEQRDTALMLLLLESGIRKAEARDLQLLHVNLEERYLTVVRGKGGKGRIAPIGDRTAQTIAELSLLDGLAATDYLWYGLRGNRYGSSHLLSRAGAIGEGTFHRWWGRCLKTVGVAYRKPHTTRHTFASRWLRDGGRIAVLSRVLGHTSIATTVDLYGHFDTDDLQTEMRRLDALRSGA